MPSHDPVSPSADPLRTAKALELGRRMLDLMQSVRDAEDMMRNTDFLTQPTAEHRFSLDGEDWCVTVARPEVEGF